MPKGREFMKLIINYDLLNRIKDTQKEFKLQRIFERSLIDVSKDCLKYHPFLLIFHLSVKVPFSVMFSGGLITSILYFFVWEPYNYLQIKYLQNVYEQQLQHLSIELDKIYVKTSKDLLKESKLYHTDYELKLTDKKIPYILQKKYINIPTYDNGDIKDTSVLQEHKLGSKEYYLSRGSVSKGYVRQYCRN